MAIAISVTFLACDSPEVLPCGIIPEDGCPIGRGGTCEDVLCAALYDCVEGAWTEVETCEGFGAGGAGAGGATTSTGGAGGACDFSFDHTEEVAGCEPDLQEPDCPGAAAEDTCAPCATGCLEFFLCTDRGWENVGFCTEDGEFQDTQGLR